MNSIGDDIYAFAKASNSLTNKKLLKQLLSRSNVSTIVICPHEYKYISEAKGIAQNLILFAPLTLQHDFASYNTFLNKLNSDEFIVYGAHTQNIPFIVELEPLKDEDVADITDEAQEEQAQDAIEIAPNESEEVKEEEEQAPSTIQPNPSSVDELTANDVATSFPNEEPTITEAETEPEITEDEIHISEDSQFESLDSQEDILDQPLEEAENITFEPIEEYSNDDFGQNEVDYSQTEYHEDVPNILEDNSQDEDVVEVSEPVLEQTEYPEFNSQDDVIIDEAPINDGASDEIEYTPLDEDDVIDFPAGELENSEEPEIDYSLDATEDYQEPQNHYGADDAMIEQAAKDVDKFLYEKLPQEDEELPEPPTMEDYASDELTEDDLNLIGDLTPEDDETNDYITEDITIDEQPPVVPIYEASDITNFEPPKLEAGDRVSTPKYGEGVVEKMVKYGNKMLCSIMFPNIGKRLIDPAMAEITKLSQF